MVTMVLTAFSPSLDYFAVSSGDGRIKIWDTSKGQIQTEFADLLSSESTNMYTRSERGNLSVDYKCMKWLSSDKKRKRKLGNMLLVLGTGSGDVLALDVAAGQLKWSVSDCHPGGVCAIVFPSNGYSIYSAGADGMVCEIDSLSGNILGKFQASTKAITCLALSADGTTLATAAGKLKIFYCSSRKKIQKFTGHPGVVRCLVFNEDGSLIFSSAIGERHVAIWGADRSKKQSACCVLTMEHPAISIDCRCAESGDIYVFAISESGVGYFWYGQTAENLQHTKPTKVSFSSEDILSKGHRVASLVIISVKLQGPSKPASVNAFLACGSLVKPSFRKILLQHGSDVTLSSAQDGVLLPINQLLVKSKKGLDVQNRVIALDRANANDASLPIPKILDLHENTRSCAGSDGVQVLLESMDVNKGGFVEQVEAEPSTLCMEDQLRFLGILDDHTHQTEADSIFMGVDLEANMSQKKMRAAVMSMTPSDALKLLEFLVLLWKSRSYRGICVLRWLYAILVNHSQYLTSLDSIPQAMNSLLKMTKSRRFAIQSLLQLSGCLQLAGVQIDKAAHHKKQVSDYQQMDESQDEDEDAEDVLYGEHDDESQISSDDNENGA